MQGAELGHRTVDRVLHVLRDRHVRRDRDRDAARLLDGAHRLVERVFRKPDHRNRGATLGEQFGGGRADA